MKISYLCVTHERPEFIPWLLWNYERQNWPDKELVIVDSSEKPFTRKRKGVRVIKAAEKNVPEKRNVALEAARGDCVTWLDDDDWRHPESANVLSGLVGQAGAVAGMRYAWFVDLFTGQTKRLRFSDGIMFSSMMVETAVAREIVFNEEKERGSDIDWLDRLTGKYSYGFTYAAPSMILCHDRNMGNTAVNHSFNRELDDPRAIIGRKAWGDTEKQLEKLRGRLRGD